MTGILAKSKPRLDAGVSRGKGKRAANNKAPKQQKKGAGAKDEEAEQKQDGGQQQQEVQQQQVKQQQLRAMQCPDQEADVDSKQCKAFLFGLKRQQQAAGEAAAGTS
jgi:hypothetical protein